MVPRRARRTARGVLPDTHSPRRDHVSVAAPGPENASGDGRLKRWRRWARESRLRWTVFNAILFGLAFPIAAVVTGNIGSDGVLGETLAGMIVGAVVAQVFYD